MLPLTEHGRGGYWRGLLMRRVETSHPGGQCSPPSLGFFAALIADNLDIGRLEVIKIKLQTRLTLWSKGG